MEIDMTNEDNANEGLIQELRRIRHQIAELEEREIELAQVLGVDFLAVTDPKLSMFYAGPESGIVWVPGLFASEFPQRSSGMSAAEPDGSEPGFSWLKNLVHVEDVPALDNDLKTFASGAVTTICRRCRLHVVGEMAIWVEFYLLATKRDEKKLPVECVACIRPIGRSGGLGSILRQVAISLIGFFDSASAQDSPLASLFESRRKEGRDSSEETIDKAWLLLAVATAEMWRLQKSWDLSFVKDGSMRYVWASDPFSEKLGLSLHEIQGRSDCDLFHTVDETDEERIGEAVMGGVAAAHFQRTRMVAGTRRVFRDSLWPVPQGGGAQARWILGVSSVVGAEETVSEGHRSSIMVKVRDKALAAAKSDGIILLTGESGSGKDYFARYIHDNSERANGPFFSINCAAINAEMAESELFGHERGAFTGAHARKRGLLELAEGGTLLLNEVGELSLPLQAKLLTFLDSRKFTRVGGEREIKVNARLVAATNKDLEEAVNQKSFRGDLYYRLSVITIEVPPLREHLEDLPGIVDDILREFCASHGRRPVPYINRHEMEAMKSYTWPGNIRELRNVLERALLFSPKGKLSLREAVPTNVFQADEFKSSNAVGGYGHSEWLLSGVFRKDESDGSLLDYTERSLIKQALEKTKNNKTHAARLLGITLSSLKSKLKTLGITGSK
jgi:DNA-binding NtrC family response regulator